MKLISIHTAGEPRLVSYLWRVILALSMLLDGIIMTLSLGFVCPTFGFHAAGRLTRSRYRLDA